MLPTEQDIGDGLLWDAENEDRYARADSVWHAAKERLNAVKAIALPHTGTVQEREQVMYASAEFNDAMEAYETARYEYRKYLLKYRRHEEERSMYQTMCANRRNAV